MENLRVGLKLMGGFVLVALITLIVGGLGVYAVQSLGGDVQALGQVKLPTVENLLRVKESLNDLKAVQRTMLIHDLTKEIHDNQPEMIQALRERYTGAMENLDLLFQAPAEKAQWEGVKQSITAWREANNRFFEAEKAGDRPKMAELAFGVCRERQVEAMGLLDKLIKAVNDDAGAAAKKASVDADRLFWGTVTGMALGTILALALGLLLARDMLRPLGKGVAFAQTVASGRLDENLDITRKDEFGQLADSLRHMVQSLKTKIAEADQKSVEAAEEARRAKVATDEANESKALAERAAEGMRAAATQLEQVVEIVSSASEELSAQVEQSSRGTEVQSSRVAETATAMEEMNATVLEVAKNASQASDSSSEARTKALEGAQIVAQVVAGIGSVQAVSATMKDDMGVLGKQAEGIGAIMNVISDIADQTNLLALNAAIEAARAGDAGRGFAVVADEVRKLAEKTMTATKEVGEAISGIQQGARKNLENVEHAVVSIEQATSLANLSGEALKEIVHLVEVATDQVRSIAAASEQQSAASEEINRSIEDINRVSSETASAMNQSAQAVGELASQAGNLRALIGRMKSGA